MSKSLHCVILTGAGISEESGLKTFRGEDGLWEGYALEDVATPEAWARDPELVLRFYNMRRQSVRDAVPNAAHCALAELEARFHVSIITQNVDDLHERAGSSRVYHLHGEVLYAQSSGDPSYRFHLGEKNIQMGDRCPQGFQLRPNVVWFGEDVTAIPGARKIARSADIFIIAGTSLVVYPAAGLIHEIPDGCQKYIVDPMVPTEARRAGFKTIEKKATEGMQELIEILRDREFR